MQGTAADIIKRAMVNVDQWLRDSGAPARMILQVHDELVFETESSFVEDLRLQVVERMSQAAKLRVPWWSTRASATTGTKRTDGISGRNDVNVFMSRGF